MNPRETPVDSTFIDVGDAVMVEPQWVIRNLLPTGLTFLAGPPKSYKSTVELAMLLSVCGVGHEVLPDDLREVPKPGVVLGLSGEASAGVLRHTAEHGFETEIPADGRFLVVDDPWRFRLDQPGDVEELLGWVTRLRPRILFIDPLRNFHVLDENDSGGMVAMIQPLQRYAVLHDMAVIIVHHSRKIGGEKGEPRMARAEDMRGSSALFGMADATLTLSAKSRGVVHIDAIFKRAESWQRDVTLNMWHEGQPMKPIANVAGFRRGAVLEDAYSTERRLTDVLDTLRRDK